MQLCHILFKEKGWQGNHLQAQINAAHAILEQAKQVNEFGKGGKDTGAPESAASPVPGPVLHVRAEKQLRFETATNASMRQFAKYLRTSEGSAQIADRVKILSETAQQQLRRALVAGTDGRVDRSTTMESILRMPAPLLANLIELTYPTAADSGLGWLNAFAALFVQLDVQDPDSYSEYINEITKIEVNSGNKETPVSSVINTLIQHLVERPKDAQGQVTTCNKAMEKELKMLLANNKLETLDDFTFCFGDVCRREARNIVHALQWMNHGTRQPNDRTRRNTDAQAGQKRSRDSSEDDPSKKKPCNPYSQCQGCGNFLPAADVVQGTLAQECAHCLGHPDRNTSGRWADCSTAKTLRERHMKSLSSKFRADDSRIDEPTLSAMARARADKSIPDPVRKDKIHKNAKPNPKQVTGELLNLENQTSVELELSFVCPTELM